MTADEVVDFLQESFAAFQQRRRSDGWHWNRPALERAVIDLEQHELIAGGDEERLILTDLGRLAGESGYEVTSVLRLVDLLRLASPNELDDAALVTAAQVTVELDDMWLPVHPKSMKEPRAWFDELSRHRVTGSIQMALRRYNVDGRGATLRAKRAGSCLLWMSGLQRQQIEQIVTRHVRESTAAGQISQVAARTADLLPLVTGIAELLHPTLDLSERVEHLRLRLQIGLPADLVLLADLMGDRLTRADYLAMAAAGLADPGTAASASDDDCAAALGRTEKVMQLRDAMSAVLLSIRAPELERRD